MKTTPIIAWQLICLCFFTAILAGCDKDAVTDGQTPGQVQKDQDVEQETSLSEFERAVKAIEDVQNYLSTGHETLSNATPSKQSTTVSGRFADPCDNYKITSYQRNECPENLEEGEKCFVTKDFFALFDRTPGFDNTDALFPESAIEWVHVLEREKGGYVRFEFDIDSAKVPLKISDSYNIDRVLFTYQDPDDKECNSPYVTNVINYHAADYPVSYDSTEVLSAFLMPTWMSQFGTELNTDSVKLTGYFVKEKKQSHWPNFQTIQAYGDHKVNGYKDYFRQKVSLMVDNDEKVVIDRKYWGFIDIDKRYTDTNSEPIGFGLEEHIYVGEDLEFVRSTLEPIYNTLDCPYSLENAYKSLEDALTDGRNAETGVVQWTKIENGEEVFKIIYDKGTDYGNCQPGDSTFQVRHYEGDSTVVINRPRVPSDG